MRPRVTSVGLIIPPRKTEGFAYPSHIAPASLQALPAKPGVYFFRNRTGVPLYIGKSINLRARVLSHLRTPEEMAMLNQARSVDFVCTAGEIGALLLESRLIKQYQPVYNAQLKYVAESYAIGLKDGGTRLQAVGRSETVLDDAACLYGLFVSRHAAQTGLLDLVRRHRLCPALLGLETCTHGRACFAHQIGRCQGACVGNESHFAHFNRLQTALEQLDAGIWPYGGPIGIVETQDRWRQVHVVDRWSYLGSLEGRQKKIPLPAHRLIDIDTYKILAGPLADGQLRISPCLVRQNAAYYVEGSTGEHVPGD